ncbi:unnamed protein product [Lactuca saligna]|uniref:Zinc finger GRF-type domain-containing protein n=1 Tax=Lactuca saligna TaxID=75948 RepID=A0AA35YIE0_LACSI|nr:unnamed protein product [Lactuca saligna]
MHVYILKTLLAPTFFYSHSTVHPIAKRFLRVSKMAICRCGMETTKLTSWTDRNPGRQFLNCSICGFVRWVDPPMCARALVVNPGLIRSMNRLEERVAIASAELWNYRLILFYSWMCFLFFLTSKDLDGNRIGGGGVLLYASN